MVRNDIEDLILTGFSLLRASSMYFSDVSPELYSRCRRRKFNPHELFRHSILQALEFRCKHRMEYPFSTRK